MLVLLGINPLTVAKLAWMFTGAVAALTNCWGYCKPGP